MFLNKLFGPQIVFGSVGGGGGGGSSSSSSSKPKPKPKTSGGGKGSSKPKSTSSGRNLDADMFAGSGYAPTKKAGTSKAKQITYSNDTNRSDRTASKVTGKTTNFNSKSSVTAKDLKAGNVSTYKAKNGTGSLTVSRGTTLDQAPTVDVGVNGGTTRSNADVYDSKDVAAPKPVSTGSSSPVTAPELIDPADGVGGGRDGGGSAKRKASKTQEDNIAIKRSAEGVDGYKRKRPAKSAANPMAIRKT